MIGLDTNILIRHLTQDEPEQASLASELIETTCSIEAPGYINRIVLCEMVWTLDRAYHYDRKTILNCIETILRATDLRVEDETAAWAALSLYNEGYDFVDALIGLTNASAGASKTRTFDKRAARLESFSRVE